MEKEKEKESLKEWIIKETGIDEDYFNNDEKIKKLLKIIFAKTDITNITDNYF